MQGNMLGREVKCQEGDVEGLIKWDPFIWPLYSQFWWSHTIGTELHIACSVCSIALSLGVSSQCGQ
jgi:hypothetical protein